MQLARMVLVMGKGGVGKSTVARGLADTLVHQGYGTALLELGTGAAGDALDSEVRDSPLTKLTISEEGALYETAAEVFGSARVAKLVFGNFAVRQLVDVVPGVREYCLLVAARARLHEYQRVVVDMPATGHGISWLLAAHQLAQLVPSGRARAQADALDSALRDPRETSYVLVSLAEPMVCRESEQLEQALITGLGVHVSHTVLNRVPPAAEVREEDLRALALQDPGMRGPLRELLAWLRERAWALSSARQLLASGHASLLLDAGTRPSSRAVERALALPAGGAA